VSMRLGGMATLFRVAMHGDALHAHPNGVGMPPAARMWRPMRPFYFVENLWIIVCVYVSPGRRTTVGKSGLFGESG